MSFYKKTVGAVVPAPGPTPVEWDDCLWPVPYTQGLMPTVSDGFGIDKRKGDGHFGMDVMHRRPSVGTYQEEKNREGKTNAHYLILAGEHAVAFAHGIVYDSEMTGSGWTVRISHRISGRPILSVYRHLKHGLVIKGQEVRAGTPLGPIGDNPASAGDSPHVHFELWDTSQNNQALVRRFAGREGGKWGDYLKWVINPYPYLARWRVIDLATGKILPHTGDKGDPGDKGSGGGGGGGKLVAGLLAMLGIGMSFTAFKKRRGYV